MRFRLLAATLVLALAASACGDPEAKKADHVRKGDEHMAQTRYKEAILEYRNALKIDARFGDARFKLAEAYLKAGRENDAAREFVNAAELLPDRADVQLRAGDILLGAREFQRARQAGEAALKANPKSVEAQLLIAHSYAGLKEMSSAVREVEEAMQLAPQDSRPLTTLGTIRLAEGDRVKAEAAYRKAVDLNPQSIPARLALGYFHWTGAANAAAEEEFKRALAIDEKNPLSNRLLALFYLTNGRAAEAEAPLLRLAETDDPAAILTVGDHFARTNREADARLMFERLKSKRQTRIAGVMRIAAIDFGAGKRAEAHAAIDEELKTQPSNAELLTLKARFLLDEGRAAEAEGLAQKAVDADAKSASSHYALGLAQMAQGKSEPATRSFNETLRLNPNATPAELRLSQLSLSSGNTDDALRRAESVRKRRPGDLSARLGVASALLARRDFTQAEAELKALRADFPDAAAVHTLSGRVMAARNDWAGAVRAFDRALEIEPTNVPALTGRIGTDLVTKKPAEARVRVSRALAAQPDNPDLLFLAGRIEAALGENQAAEKHFRRVIDVNPSSMAAYTALGQIYLRMKRLDDARAEFEKLATLRPDAVGAKTMVGIIYDIQNKPQDARRAYEEVVRATNRAPVAANNLAWNYAETGENLDMALQLAQSAKQQLPDSHEVDDTLGWVYMKRNLPDLAIPAFERCVKASPEVPEYHYHLGAAYAKVGRAADARRSLERALQLRPDFRGADDARSMLASLKS